MSGLIARIEGASEASRQLDADVARSVGRIPEASVIDVDGTAWHNRCGYSVPYYTSSIDEVLTLIDPADEWQLSTIYSIARAEVGVNRDHQTSWPGRGEHEGNNPVLALLSAALRARETTPSIKGGA